MPEIKTPCEARRPLETGFQIWDLLEAKNDGRKREEDLRWPTTSRSLRSRSGRGRREDMDRKTGVKGNRD